MMNHRGWIGSSVLLATVVALGAGLAVWKYSSIRESTIASANQPEPMEAVTVAVAREREHRRTTTSIGTVLALRSVTLRNELPGTVRESRAHTGADRRGGNYSRGARRLRRGSRAEGPGSAGSPGRDGSPAALSVWTAAG